MARKFVPRQRKRKVLDRERALENGTRQGPQEDSNALEILPGQKAEAVDKKAKLREELNPEGVKISGKKAKRLDKYIEKKLRKDESRELLAQLAERKIDTSLFASTRSLGQAKETKKEAISRALREKAAALPADESRDAVLLRRRREVEDESGDEEDSVLPHQENPGRASNQAPLQNSQKHSAAAPEISNPIGSGLKRPLELDGTGRPVLAKRQKRGGVKTRPFPIAPEFPPEEASDDWDGFSSDSEISGQASDHHSDDGSEAQNTGDEEQDAADESGDSEEESDSEASESEEEDPEATRSRQKERSSAFLAWARHQRHEAIGYTPTESGSAILDIPKPANFQPRPLEQDPLPLELQQTTNTSRKVHTVVVTRDKDIDDARLNLPVVAEENKIMEAIHNNNVVIICGATGSGKTTQVPQFLFEAGYGSPGSPTPGMIGVTQPRRVAAVSMSKRVGQELGNYSSVSAYQIRFEGTVSPKTAVKFMTDGVLLREVAQDMALRKYSAVIIDEAHERSVNTDILVAILSRVVKLRADMAKEDRSLSPLKLVIMSATLRVDEFAQNPRLFPTPPVVVEVEGRQHPVTVHFSRKTSHDYVEEAFRKISRGHRKLPPGGFLVFLTGQNEIFQLSKRLKSAFGGLNSVSGPKVRISASEAPLEVEDIEFGEADDRNVNDMDDELIFDEDDEEDGEDGEDEFQIDDEESSTGPLRIHVLPLYSLLPTKEQMRVFEPPPDGSRQIILATNVAETSLTIPGIRYVFDCGRSKERRFDPVSGVQSFEIGWISKASASQRSGRAGRTGPGHCYRLYSSAVYERDFPEFADPELLRMPIEGVVLQLKSMNLQHVVNFPFPTPPSRSSLVKAEKLLTYLSAISSEGQVTQLGSTMSIFPLSPRFARILLVGHLHDCLPYTIALVAGLSAAEVFIPENQAIPAVSQSGEDFRTNEEVIAEDRQARIRKAFNAVHRNFCFLDDKADAIKLLQVVGEFAHDPTEAWCDSHFVRFKVLKEIFQLQNQIVDLLKTNIPAFASLKAQERLDPPTPKQVQALKQMVASGFVDQVAIRADKAPTPPSDVPRKPRRAIDVPYIPLVPLDSDKQLEPAERLVYIHPASPLAHLSVTECPDYVVYSHLQRAGNTAADSEKRPKTRMHALTDVSGAQLAALAKGTPLVSYGKPIKEVRVSEEGEGKMTTREVWVVPFLKAEGTGGQGWPLPATKVKQKKVSGKGWVVE